MDSKEKSQESTTSQDYTTVNPLVPLGVGIAAGAGLLWLTVELFPIIAIGGAVYLISKGLQNKEN